MTRGALLILASLGLLATALSLAFHRPGLPEPSAAEAPPERYADRPVGLEVSVARNTGAQIATRRSEDRVRLQFRCETLGHNTKAVWSHMELKVRVEDEAGQLLAECAEPWEPSALSIPADVEHLTLIAKGYKREVVPAPRASGHSTVIFLEPDALARVRARNLPSTPGNRFAISARLATGTDAEGRPVLHGAAYGGRPGVETRGGEVAVDIKVPSGVPSVFLVSRSTTAREEREGFVRLASNTVTLGSGETREVIIDLMEFDVLEGRVTGVASSALKDQVLSLGNVVPGAVHEVRSQIVLDANGEFRAVGLPRGPVTLQLRTQGGSWPALQQVPGGSLQWRAEAVGFLVLEPETPVVGVVPVQGGRELQRPFQVQANCPPGKANLTHRIPLFTRQLVDRDPLYFFVPGIGHFHRSLKGELPDPEGLYRIEVPAPGGSLVVSVVDRPSQGIHLFARPVPWSQTRRWINITGEQAGDDWRFDGLAAGEYELVINYSARRGDQSIHSERSLPVTVVVTSGQETRLTVRMPELLEIRGQVENWQSIPISLRPSSLQLYCGGRPHTARHRGDGSFELTVLGPWDGVSEVAFFNPHLMKPLKTTDITWLPGENRFSVMFPGEIRERWLTAAPIAGGQMSIHAHLADARGAARATDRGQHFRPQNGNRFMVAESPPGVDGILLERVHHSGREHRLLRGWFRLHTGGPDEVHLEPRGRWVQVAMSNPGGTATLALKPPAWWRHPPYPWASLHLQGTAPQPLWIPDQATAIMVDGDRQIPVAGIGDKLVVD